MSVGVGAIGVGEVFADFLVGDGAVGELAAIILLEPHEIRLVTQDQATGGGAVWWALLTEQRQ